MHILTLEFLSKHLRASVFLTLLFFVPSMGAQSKIQNVFGEPTAKELALSSYEKDPESSAVVLYENGKVYVEVVNGYVTLVKEVHKKVKVFNVKEFEGATIVIPFYSTKKVKEKVLNVKAITHNGSQKQFLSKSQVFIKNETEYYSTSNFTFPNVKDGSILEYKYRLESPFFHSFEWNYQGDYPKLHSEFNSEIPGNYKYRIALRGNEKIDRDTTYLKRSCFYIEGYGDAADCIMSLYIMKDVPAFLIEDYMLSKENYLSSISYELKESYDLSGQKTKHTKNWKDVDKEFRQDREMGRQINYKSFFEKAVPKEILDIKDDLERAKAVYYFIQNHFSWNEKYRIFNDIRVKQAFEGGTGNIAEINLSLINALKVAKIEAHISLSRTRNKAIPNQLFPTLTQFNYVMAFVTIGDADYYLDATNKYTEFGVLPIRALNKMGRVMDFKNGSYWKPIIPYSKNVEFIYAQLSLNNEGVVSGTVDETNIGFLAAKRRSEISLISKSEYLEKKQDFCEIDNFVVENFNTNKNPIKETFFVQIIPEEISGDIYFYPYFLMGNLLENPFRSDKRFHPIELDYPKSYVYVLRLELGDHYKVKNLPENKSILMSDKSGSCKVIYNENENVINLRFNLKVDLYSFDSEYYNSLKAFFSKIIEIRSNEPIVLEKQ